MMYLLVRNLADHNSATECKQYYTIFSKEFVESFFSGHVLASELALHVSKMIKETLGHYEYT